MGSPSAVEPSVGHGRPVYGRFVAADLSPWMGDTAFVDPGLKDTVESGAANDAPSPRRSSGGSTARSTSPDGTSRSLVMDGHNAMDLADYLFVMASQTFSEDERDAEIERRRREAKSAVADDINAREIRMELPERVVP